MSEERVLAGSPDVLDCTVVAVRDGERVVTDVLLQLAAGADRERDRTKEVAALLEEPVAATLRRVIAVDEADIPLGPTGKVRKVLLRERHLAAEHGASTGPGTSAGTGPGADTDADADAGTEQPGADR
jgi:acyl-coenzyme A synthetase/AMP-(fatty) acid ligase